MEAEEKVLHIMLKMIDVTKLKYTFKIVSCLTEAINLLII